MIKVAIPNNPDGLQELLNDTAKFKEAVASCGGLKEFIAEYGAVFSAANSDTETHLQDQIQAGVAKFIREQGAGGRSPVNIGARLSNGGPELSVNGSPIVSRGRGAIYNKNSSGAAFERAYPNEADRFESIGEYCQAIQARANAGSHKRNRVSLLHKLEVVESFMNSYSSEDGGAGGFLIPEIMRSELLSMALEKSVVRSRATVIPMSTLTLLMPAIDDTSHATSVLGGVTFAWTEEAASITESQGTFSTISLVAKKLAGFFGVPNQLLSDAPAFSAYFDTCVPEGLAFFEDVGFMNESGVGAPLGFINCPASVSVAAESGQQTKTIVYENIVNMYSRMLPTSLPNAVWIASIDTFPQLATMALSVGTGGGPVWIGGYGGPTAADTPPMTIMGRPVFFTEKVGPLGTTGDISFVDLRYYMIGDRQQIEIASSDQYLFQNDKTAFRIIERVDGRPWIQSALTPHNGSSNTLSPFVQIATR